MDVTAVLRSNCTDERIGALLDAGKVADALWEIAREQRFAHVLGGEERRRAMLQIGKGEKGRLFSDLEDFVIDEYLHLLRDGAPPDVHVFDCDMSRLAVQSVQGSSEAVEMLSVCLRSALAVMNVALIPLHLSGIESDVPHWVLVRIERTPSSFSMHTLDSAVQLMHENPHAVAEKHALLNQIASVLDVPPSRALGQWRGWPSVPQQCNNTDCGIFMLEFVRLLVSGKVPNPKTLGGDMRRRMTLELAERWIL